MMLTLVTGGTRGIGAAIARRLADDHHDLVLTYRSDEAAAAKVADATRRRGVSCTTIRTDLTDATAVDRLFSVVAEHGELTGLINNAGATYRYAALVDTPVEEIRTTIELNLTAAILASRAAVRVMSLARGGSGGVIVNISSGAATIGSPGEYVHYAAAKAGLDTLTLGLGREVAADGIRVVGVAPGLIDTDIHARTGDPQRVERLASTIPMDRSGAPSEIADAVAWLMSPAASYVTATTLRVAGGR